MNFISVLTEEEVPMELKYCERCGGLWLRRGGEAEVYCVECRARIAAVGVLIHRREPRPARAAAHLKTLLGVAEEVEA